MRFSRALLSGALALLAALVPAQMVQAQAAQPPLSAYGDLPGVEDMVLSPSGQRLAMLVTINGRRMFIAVDDQMKPILKASVDDLKVRSIDFVGENMLMIQRSSTEKLGHEFIQDKLEFWQSILLPLDGSDPKVVFAEDHSLLSAIFGYYGTRSIDGRPTAFFGAVELKRAISTGSRTADYVFNHGRPALYAVDLLTNTSRKVAPSAREGYDSDWLVDADGNVIATLEQSESTGDWKIKSGKLTIAEGTNPASSAYLIAIGKDGNTVIYGARDKDTGDSLWFEVPVDGSAAPVSVFDDVDIERIFTDRSTGRLIGYLTEGEGAKTVFYDPALAKKVRKVKAAFASLSNSMVDWTPGFDKVLVQTSGNGDSGTYYTVALAALRAEPVGFERPAIGPERVGPISKVQYKAADGLELDGILTLPPGRQANSLPLVMFPHGGPHAHDTVSFDWWAQAFASRGYAVFQPNFRGSTNRDQAFVEAGYGEWGRKMQTDISDGLSELVKQGIVDPKRVCIMGASYGGYAALAGVTLQHGLYRCAVSVAGVADVSLMSRVENRESGDSKIRARSLEEELGPRSGYKDISPRFHAAEADAPILLIHGRDDTVVNIQQSLKMADALKDAGKPYEFLELKGEDHWLSLGVTRKAMLEAAVAFVQKHNPSD